MGSKIIGKRWNTFLLVVIDHDYEYWLSRNQIAKKATAVRQTIIICDVDWNNYL